MKVRVAALVLLAALGLGLSACGSSRGRTVELPGGVLPEEEQQNAPKPNWFDRMMGHDVRPNVGPCPLMGVLYDTARVVQFAQPNVQRYANIAYTDHEEVGGFGFAVTQVNPTGNRVDVLRACAG